MFNFIWSVLKASLLQAGNALFELNRGLLGIIPLILIWIHYGWIIGIAYIVFAFCYNIIWAFVVVKYTQKVSH